MIEPIHDPEHTLKPYLPFSAHRCASTLMSRAVSLWGGLSSKQTGQTNVDFPALFHTTAAQLRASFLTALPKAET